MVEYSKSTHAELISGRKKPIAWGVSADALYKIQKSPYLFVAIIDGQAQSTHLDQRCNNVPVCEKSILTDLDPNDFVVVVFADLTTYFYDIVEAVSRFGSYDVVTPFCPWKQFGAAVMEHKLDLWLEPLVESRVKQNSVSSLEPHNITLWLYKLVSGGAEKQMVMLALALACQGREVTLITAIEDSYEVIDWSLRLSEQGVHRIILPLIKGNLANQFENNANLSDSLLNIFSSFSTYHIIETMQVLKKIKPDLVVSYMPDGAMIATVAGLLANTPNIMFSVRNMAPLEQSNDDFCYATLAVSKDVIPVVFKQFLQIKGVNMLSNSIAGQVSYANWMQVQSSLIKVIPNGFDSPQKTEIDLHQQYGIHQGTTVVVGVMRLVPQKRPCLFLECVQNLSLRISNLRVFLLGDGPLRPDLENTIKELNLQDIVTLVGNYPSPADFMAIADVLVHTALYEGFPNVLLEALAMGCPIVATDVGGCREVLAQELHSISLCSSDEPMALVEMMLSTISADNKFLFNQYRTEILNQYSLEKLGHRTLDACSKVKII